MKRFRFRRSLLGCALVASMALFPACSRNKPAAKSASSGIAIHGRILAADGSVPKLAHVRYTKPDGTEVSLDAGPDGSFEISVPPGVPVTLQLAAVDHVETPVPVLLEGTAPAEVTAMLAPNPFAPSFDSVSITGSWNGHNFSNAVPMTKQKDGTWVWDGAIPGNAATIKYELIGITTNGHSVNGTMGQGYAYDGGGDFDSIVPVKDHRVHVVFDPSRLPHFSGEGLPKIVWDAKHQDLERLASLAVLFNQWRYRFATAFAAHRKAGGTATDFHFDNAGLLDAIHKAMATDSPPAVQQYAAVLLMSEGATAGIRIKPEEMATILQVAPPSSPYWGFGPTALPNLRPPLVPHPAPILERFIKDNPVPEVRAWALASQGFLAQKNGDTTTLRSTYDTLKKNYANLPGISWVLRTLNPDKKVQVGKPVPHFDVTLLDGSHFTDRDLHGHWTLMDFWATWCPPCVGEMPNLDSAWKQFHSKGLQMLSLSLDRNRDAVARFRKEKWKMPWKHALLKGGFKDTVTTTFEVVAIPSPILVRPDGTIAATGEDLRGANLATTLAHFLEAGSKEK